MRGTRAALGLVAEGLTVHLGGRPALRDVDLALFPGEVTALIGPNGAGKSTLLGALAGDLRPIAGGVSLDGRNLRDWSSAALARRRAVLTQRPTVGFAFSVRQVVQLGRHAVGQRGADGWRRRGPAAARYGGESSGSVIGSDVVEAVLAEVGLSGYGARPVDTLSGGEMARVHLARVLAQEAPILLLDEPTAALDLRHQHLVMAVARRHARRGGTTVVVLHDLNLAAAYADRVVLLADGAVTADGTAPDVLTPALLDAAYGHPVCLVVHPEQGWQAVVADRLVGRADRADATERAAQRTEDRGPARLP